MFVTFLALVIHAVVAVPFPPPTGPYHVGYMQHAFNHTTPNDPIAPENSSWILLATIYYPTLTTPIPGNNTAPYLDPTNAKLTGDIFQYPNDSLQSLTTWNVFNAPTLDKATRGITQKPTVILSPGANENAIKYNVLSSELASYGYTVVALDHPGEALYVQLPDGSGIHGLNASLSVWTSTFLTAVYHMRVSDTLAVIRKLYPPFVEAIGAPFNTTHYLVIGHSLGGAVAAGALAAEGSILGGVNLDGLFFDLPDVKKPFLMLAGAEHTPAVDSTWSPFSANQSGWYQWLNITDSNHRDFSDMLDWVDLQGLRDKTLSPLLGKLWGPRMDHIIRTFVVTFFSYVLGESHWLEIPSALFPEVVYINGSCGALVSDRNCFPILHSG